MVDIQRRKERKKNKVKCHICDKEITIDNLNQHINNIHKKIKVKCPHCDLEMYKNNIKPHIKTQH